MWIAEHHFSEYGIAPDVAVLAGASPSAWAHADRHRGQYLPFNHPVRTAESFAMVDVLSDGRLDFGVGRGYQPAEFAGFGLPMDESRERFDESLEIIRQAWTQETVEFDGRFFQIHGLSVHPRPGQQPHPPIWGAAVSPESFELIAQGAALPLRAVDHAARADGGELQAYRRVWREAGHAPDSSRFPRCTSRTSASPSRRRAAIPRAARCGTSTRSRG